MVKQTRRCPRCGDLLVVKRCRSDGAKFVGCMAYPDCRYVESKNQKKGESS